MEIPRLRYASLPFDKFRASGMTDRGATALLCKAVGKTIDLQEPPRSSRQLGREDHATHLAKVPSFNEISWSVTTLCHSINDKSSGCA